MAGARRHGDVVDSREMSVEPAHAPPPSAATTPAGRIGMAIFQGTDAMGFGGLLLAYAVLRARAADWPAPGQRFDRTLAAVLTALLLASGVAMAAALAAIRAGRPAARWLLATAALGAAFLAGQGIEFHALATAFFLGLVVVLVLLF